MLGYKEKMRTLLLLLRAPVRLRLGRRLPPGHQPLHGLPRVHHLQVSRLYKMVNDSVKSHFHPFVARVVCAIKRGKSSLVRCTHTHT